MDESRISQRVKDLPRWVTIGGPAVLFVLLVWPTPYHHRDKIVGSESLDMAAFGIFTPSRIWNEEQAEACLANPDCRPIHVRTRRLLFFGEELFDTWRNSDDDSRWLTGSMTYSADGGFRIVSGMDVTEEAVSIAPGSFSRMMRLDAERRGTPPPLVTQEWYMLESGDAATEMATGREVVVERDTPQLRVVIEVQSEFGGRRLVESGLYLADLDNGIVYWQFQFDPVRALELDTQREQDAAMHGTNYLPPQGDPTTLELVAPLFDNAAFAKLKSGDLHLMKGQMGWVLPLDPQEAGI